jgi:hypothetical protein
LKRVIGPAAPNIIEALLRAGEEDEEALSSDGRCSESDDCTINPELAGPEAPEEEVARGVVAEVPALGKAGDEVFPDDEEDASGAEVRGWMGAKDGVPWKVCLPAMSLLMTLWITPPQDCRFSGVSVLQKYSLDFSLVALRMMNSQGPQPSTLSLQHFKSIMPRAWSALWVR